MSRFGTTPSGMTAEQKAFMMSVPGLHSMPSPLKTSVIVGAVGLGLAYLLGKKPLKWALMSSGAAFGVLTIAETSYVAGVGASMYAMSKQSPPATSGWW